MSSLLPPYAELHCLSNFTFLRGASHPAELVERAFKLGYTSLAITDECSFAGVVRAHVEAQKYELHLILGTEVTLACGLKLVLLATNREGYGNLSEWITLGRCRAPKGSYELHRADIAGASRENAHLQNMPDCLALFVPNRTAANDVLAEQAAWVAATFPNRAWIAVELLQRGDDDLWLEKLTDLSCACHLPLVAAGDVHMHVRSRKPLQDTLAAIRLGKPLAECGLELQPNAEQHLRQRMRLAKIYPAELLEQTLIIARRCQFSLKELQYQYPEEIVPTGKSLSEYLRELTYQGAVERFKREIPAAIRKKIEHELALIAELSYEPYFLTVYDIVRFARSQNILCQGRGSAANSMICYCLGITAIGPDQAKSLLFERFISKERNEPPDIDVDFEHERREEVMQYIYQKYGRHRAALTAALITYRPRSALKDVGKALGMDYEQVNRLSGSHQWWDGREIGAERLREQGLDPESPIVKKLVSLTQTLMGFPRHLSQHTGGFVIARDSLARLVPIENAAMRDRNVIQWDKDDLDAMGLLKVDVLALGMLSALRRALDFISLRRGEIFMLPDIPPEDPETYEMICKADTIGVFQIESRAQMSMLPRLRPKEFYDLVIQVAIVRPGPIQGDMVHPYLKRRENPKLVTYPGPEVKEALERTYGVPIFQEQVMQIAMLAADFTPSEADSLRRSMAAWKRKGDVHKFYQRLVDGMTNKGYKKEFADRIFRQIEGFGEYGFPESHAASFALLAYASAWIKCHEPAAFLAALLNAQPLGFYSPSQLVQDARRHQVEVRPPDIAISDWDCALEESSASAGREEGQPAVRLGLRLVKGLSADAGKRIMKVRAIKAFESVDDLARRAELPQQDLQALARANALLSLAGHRRQAAWQVSGVLSAPALLRNAPVAEDGIALPSASEGQEIVADYASIGLTLNRHPLALLRDRFNAMKLSTAREMKSFGNGRLVWTTGLVTMRQRPGTANGTVFVSLEDETGITNVIIWPDLMERQRKEILNASLLAVHGVWQRKGEVAHLIAKRVVDYSALLGELMVTSRNFH